MSADGPGSAQWSSGVGLTCAILRFRPLSPDVPLSIDHRSAVSLYPRYHSVSSRRTFQHRIRVVGGLSPCLEGSSGLSYALETLNSPRQPRRGQFCSEALALEIHSSFKRCPFRFLGFEQTFFRCNLSTTLLMVVPGGSHALCVLLFLCGFFLTSPALSSQKHGFCEWCCSVGPAHSVAHTLTLSNKVMRHLASDMHQKQNAWRSVSLSLEISLSAILEAV